MTRWLQKWWQDRVWQTPVDARFLSSIGVETDLFQLASLFLGRIPSAWGCAAWKAEARLVVIDETQGLCGGVTTGTCERTGTGSENGFRSLNVHCRGIFLDSKTSRLQEVATLRLVKFASETGVRVKTLVKVRSDTSLLASCGSSNSAASCSTFSVSCNSRNCCESRFTSDSLQSSKAQRALIVRFSRSCNAMLFVFNSRISSSWTLQACPTRQSLCEGHVVLSVLWVAMNGAGNM